MSKRRTFNYVTRSEGHYNWANPDELSHLLSEYVEALREQTAAL